MAKKETSIGKVNAPDRLEVMHLVANKRVNDLGVGLKITKPDAAKVTAAMAKTKKPAEYFMVLDDYALWVEIRAGGTVLTLGSVDFKKEKDVVKRRALLAKVRATTELVTTADLAAFDKAFPPPPDPKAIAELQAKVKEKADKLARLKSDRDSATYNYKSYDGMDDASAKEFEDWATVKKFERFLMFIGAVDAKQPGGFIIIKFMKKGGELYLDLPAAVTAKIVQSHKDTGGGKVDFAPARKLILKKIDDTMLGPYNKEKKAALTTQITALETELKPLAIQLKAMTGR